MNFEDFAGEIQHRTEGASLGEGVRNSRAVLETLGERLDGDEATDLAAPLPGEIDRFLTDAPDEHAQRFGYDEFVSRVAEKAGAEESDAAFYGQAVVAFLAEQEPGGEFQDLEDALPADYEPLFELVGVSDDEAPW